MKGWNYKILRAHNSNQPSTAKLRRASTAASSARQAAERSMPGLHGSSRNWRHLWLQWTTVCGQSGIEVWVNIIHMIVTIIFIILYLNLYITNPMMITHIVTTNTIFNIIQQLSIITLDKESGRECTIETCCKTNDSKISNLDCSTD